MKKVTVLGAGLVGSAMAIDLSKNFDVTSVDIDEKALNALAEKYHLNVLTTDLSKAENVKLAIQTADLVVNAVPGFMGFETMRSIIEAEKNVVDISFFPENPFELDKLAKEKNVMAVVDCGVAPGMSNIICGNFNKKMAVKNYKCYVGGLPVVRTLPFEYKAPFSPIDVIEEYIRPAKFVVNHKLVTKAPLTDREMINFEGLGTLEAFNTDGLRTLYQTMKIPNMIEKTMRYPGTMDYIQMLKDVGFFCEKEVEVKGKTIKPIDLTAKLLINNWKLQQNEEDITVMRVCLEGEKDGKQTKIVYDLFDRYDKKTGIISMARTTGYTATAVANLFLNNEINLKGIVPPEKIGENEENFNAILNYLEVRGVEYKYSEILS